MTSVTRRQFMAAGTAAGAALATHRVFGQRKASADRIRVGCIGTGDRASALMGELQKIADEHNVRIVAVCDVWKINREAAAARVKEWWGQEPFQTSHYQDVISRKDVDAIIVATPDFWHMPITIEALKTGKDVYVEKPMAIKVDEANEALKLAREKDCVVQVGTQRRSEGAYRANAKVFASGVLGKVSRATSTVRFNSGRWDRPYNNCKAQDVDWNAFVANLPTKPSFDPKLLRQWQLSGLCTNGVAGLWMPHLVDLLHIVTGAKYPVSAVSHGGVYVYKDGRDTPDTFTALVEYPEGILFDWTMDLADAAGGITFNIYGNKATLDVQNHLLIRGQPPAKVMGGSPGEKIPAERSESHMGNWLSCIRTRSRPNADIQYGHQHAIATIMAHQALVTGRRQRWDAENQKIVEG